MTRGQLRKMLSEMEPGQYVDIPYDLYAEIFPPGEPDEGAREACYNFAKELGCRIDNKADSEKVSFVKDH